MAGYITYLLIVALPAYLLSLITPYAGLGWVILLAAASLHRYLEHKDDDKERRAFLYLALPVYIFSALMVIMWFMVR